MRVANENGRGAAAASGSPFSSGGVRAIPGVDTAWSSDMRRMLKLPEHLMSLFLSQAGLSRPEPT